VVKLANTEDLKSSVREDLQVRILPPLPSALGQPLAGLGVAQFPQHGAGRKHLRPMVLEPWQWSIVKQHPAEFVRGCIESDGGRRRRLVRGRKYPKDSFPNHSEDIRRLFMCAGGLIDLRSRRANRVTVSIARRADVATLDRLLGDGRAGDVLLRTSN
jgi:hypothetical protein